MEVVKTYRTRENSWIARLAAAKLNSRRMAIVVGNTIHLYGVSVKDFENDPCWLKHELCHIQQFREHGFLNFIYKYLLESIRHGYYNNRYEVEARQAEKL